MEQKHTCASICDHLPTLSANHPWLVEDDENNNRDHIVYTMCDPPSQHRCRIPPSIGKRIHGCFYGWVILSNHPHNDMWSLWNPMTSKIIRLPRLIPKRNTILPCCLSSPPDDHGSIFMFTTKDHTIVFCRLDCKKRKRLKWVEMSYAKQLENITGYNGGFLFSLTCCNGKVYALNNARIHFSIIHIDIVVKGREIVISLLPYLRAPYNYMNGCWITIPFLQGCCTELFYIELGLTEVGHVTKETVGGVCVCKLDTTDIAWDELEDLKDSAFFLDLACGYSTFYSPSVSSSDLGGGYVHYRYRSGNVIHSYDIKNKTIALSSMPTTTTTSHMSECCRLQQGNEMVVRDNSTRIEESRLVNIPFDVLKRIMELCVGVEYLNFRATCKQCHLAAPTIQWSKGGRLQAHSLVSSPWLMVLDKYLGIISFIDPMFGDKYFLKTPIGNVEEIHCSMYGWLLIRKHNGNLMFYNPFSSDIRELPQVPNLDSYCFSAPPTSSDCMVVGFTPHGEWQVYIHYVAREPSWRRFHLNFCGDVLHSFHFATLYGSNLYALYNNGGLEFVDTDNNGWRKVEGPRSSCSGSLKQNFLMKCDQQLLLVIVSEFGESVEVFKLNGSTEWEKIESLGRHVIYIGGKACLCIEAKTPITANKIYFPRVHSENRKIVFYSLETKRYHTSNIEEESFGDFMGTQHHLDLHVWIEPSWS